jgi:hypothetical protein
MFKPKALVDAYSLAKIQEDYMFNLRKNTKPQWNALPYNNAARNYEGEKKATGWLGDKVNFFPQQKMGRMLLMSIIRSRLILLFMVRQHYQYKKSLMLK